MPQVRPVIQRSKITQKNSFISNIEYSPINVKIEEDLYSAKSIKTKNSYTAVIDQDLGNVKINEVLPFRVKFINMGVTGYNIPPIGIAIIGYNNYIL